MTNTQERNNIVLGCLVAVAVLLLAIPVQWFTITNSSLQVNGPKEVAALLAHDYPGVTFNVTGVNGNISFLVQLPIWLLLCISSFGIIVLALNILGFIAVPRLVPTLCLVIPGIYYLIPFFNLGSRVSIGAGPVMALLATILGLVLNFKKVRAANEVQLT
jgi:hypothetical protein